METVTVRHGWLLGPPTLAGVLTALGAGVGLSPEQWLTGLVLGAGWIALVRGGAAAARALTPADLVTLFRSMLACGAAALVVDSAAADSVTGALVSVAVVALLLDLVDGRVARATGSSPFGARFDGEADAFLILVLSAHVAATGRPWVLVIGAARYLFGAAGLWWSWLATPLPYRYWRKVVTAVQGVALVVAVAGVLPGLVVEVALLVALTLLAESFGRDVVWSWLHRPVGPVRPATPVRDCAGPGALAHVVRPTRVKTS